MIKVWVQLIVFQGPANKFFFFDEDFFLRKVTVTFQGNNSECPKQIKNPRQIKDKIITYLRCGQHSSMRMQALSVRPPFRNEGDCAYLLRAGGCRSPASHPGTGFSAKGPGAAIPLC